MTTGRRKWLSALGVVLLVGTVVTSIAAGNDDRHKNPFSQILQKLDQILTKLDNGSGNDNHTLRWDTNHPLASRFVKLAAFNNEAVLDKNTGLVWEQAPGSPNQSEPLPWQGARGYCADPQHRVGNTAGWRLPSVVELASLQDPTSEVPFVPTSVFTGVQPKLYWSATTDADRTALAWYVDFGFGGASTLLKTDRRYVWCVRGPMQESMY